MTTILRQSTASQDIAIGPFIDDTDFKTAETALTIANTDIKLMADGGASANKNSGGGTHRVNGVYTITLDATDTATVGDLFISVVMSGALPVFHRCYVMEEAAYDILYGAGAAGVVPTVTTLTGHTAQTGDSYARLGTPAGASVSADIAAIKSDSAAILTDTADMQPKLGTPSADISADIAAVKAETASILTDTAEIGTAGAGLTDLGGRTLDSGTAQAGASTTITLQSGAVATDDYYNGSTVVITGGTGVGQAQVITDYVGSTKVATVSGWATAPDATSTYQVLPLGLVALSAADVNTEVDTALTDIGLDHLVSASVAGTDITDNSIFAKLVSASATADWDDFVNTTDSLQAIRDRGDSAWITGAGGSNPFVLQNTTIATLASQTSFTLTAGSADNDTYNNMLIVVTDSATSTQKAVGVISDYVGSTKTVTLREDPAIFTMAVGDTVDVLAISKDVADILVDTGTTIPGTIATVDSNVAAILVDTGTTIPALIGTPAGADIAADIAAVKSDTAAVLTDTGTTIPALIGTPAGADVSADIAAIKAETASIVADTNELQTDWANGGRLDLLLDAVKAVTDLLPDAGALSSLATASALATVGTNVDSILVDTGTTIPAQITGLNDPTAEAIADAVWDEATSGHVTAGTFGKLLADVLVDTGTTLPALIAALNDVSTADILAAGDVDGFTVEQTLKLILATAVGKLSGAATTTVTIRSADDAFDRVVATVDADGNRSAVTLTETG